MPRAGRQATRNSRSNSRSASIATRTNIKGQFAAAPWRNRCEQCHNGATFKTTSLHTGQAPEVELSRSPGGHKAVACNECHKPTAGYKGNALPLQSSRLHDLPRGCSSGAIRAAHGCAWCSRAKPLGCEACHSTREWKDLTKFDHAQTQFPAAGIASRGGLHRLPQAAEHGADICGMWTSQKPPSIARDCHRKSACRPVRRPCQRLRQVPQQQSMEAIALRSRQDRISAQREDTKTSLVRRATRSRNRWTVISCSSTSRRRRLAKRATARNPEDEENHHFRAEK